MKNILIISGDINEITNLRKLFGEDFKVSGSNSASNAFAMMQRSLPDLVFCHFGADMSLLFDFYKKVRSTPATAKLPLVFVVNDAALKIISNNIVFDNAKAALAPLTKQSVKGLNDYFLSA
ncbi:MAG: hypothetical protein FWH20_07640 [Oscillospiraceae bacterium]|nr:hypothetical protein [Oscillospiraceae bacterium]